ncbi:MAG: 50S ribosomal protein L24 [Candidatus Saganbacteria bacterium]|nr:50S ribosomal protein L24 [Candidatus Saganbacteria bacterium]
MRLKKDDTVIVLRGKDKGKKGKVLSVSPKNGKAIVERVHVVKRHQKATKNFQGGIIEKPLPIPLSVIMLVCPRCARPTKVGSTVVDGKSVRVCKECKEIIDKV